MPAGELYVPLAADFANNRKVRALMRYGREARQARDLFVQMLLYCKGSREDGFVPDEQIGILVYPDPEKTGKRDADHLAEVGLIERGDGGWTIPGWLERNPSKADIERKSAAKARGARLANHRRWHVEGDNPDPECEWCRKESQNTDQTTDHSTDQNSDQRSDVATDLTTNQTSDQNNVITPIDVAKRSDSKEEEEEEEEEEEKTLGRRAGRAIEPGSDEDPDFCAFWIAYPRKAAKGQARKTWKTLVVKKRIDPKTLILGAERYRDDRTRPRDLKYIPHPSTWLNSEGWLDQEHDEAPPPPARPTAFWEN